MSLNRTWAALIALSAGSTALAASGIAGRALALAVLVLAWAKAELILRRYLHLSRAPAIARGFSLGLALFLILAAGLAWLAPSPGAG